MVALGMGCVNRITGRCMALAASVWLNYAGRGSTESYRYQQTNDTTTGEIAE
jgi:hypothetical protein